MRTLTAVLFFVMISLCVNEAFSLDLFGVGPRAGYYKSQDAEEGNLMAGAAARLKLSPVLGIEGSIDYRSERYLNGAVTVKSWPVMATALVYPLPIVYGLAGFGWDNTTFDFDAGKLGVVSIEDKTEQEGGWHFGGGVELPLGGTTLAADIRYVFLDYDFSDVPGSGDVKSDFYAITVSLLFGL